MISGDDLEAFGYWDMVDAYPPKEKTVLEMVEEYRVAVGQPIGMNDAELHDNYKSLQMAWKLIEEEYEELGEVCKTQLGVNEHETLKELSDLVYVLYGYAALRGWNLDEAVRRVHENNMGRMYQPDGTIKRREDGKILKNPEYPKVELGDLV
jgi:uncharacterized protein YabN with tetrapyrrole methylase and pyrophosphatase domain